MDSKATFGLLACGLILWGCAHSPSSTGSSHVQAEMVPPVGNPTGEPGQDPIVTDPDHYTAILENDHIRVLRYHDSPGARTHQHRHPDSVLYALSSFRRRLEFPDGTVREREFETGDVMWIPAQTHVGENIGATDTEVLLVEVKSAAAPPVEVVP